MSGLEFRNVDASPSDEVTSWPYEALVTVIDRGLVPDWRPILAEIRRAPSSDVARRVGRYLSYREPDGAGTFFRLAIECARTDAARSERAEVAARVRQAVELSALSKSALAAEVGTSASRLSTYLAGTVTPSAALLVRMERTARRTVPGGSESRATDRVGPGGPSGALTFLPER